MRITPVIAFALLAACTDDPAPTVTVTAATPDMLTPADDRADDLTITVDYDDADGDLGEGIARIHDCRDATLVTELPIPAIAPKSIVDDHTHITGTLELHVNDVGAAAAVTLPDECDELGVAALSANESIFCVVLVDAAGHVGSGDCTQAIALVP
jgi:hypothetical protein